MKINLLNHDYSPTSDNCDCCLLPSIIRSNSACTSRERSDSAAADAEAAAAAEVFDETGVRGLFPIDGLPPTIPGDDCAPLVDLRLNNELKND